MELYQTLTNAKNDHYHAKFKDLKENPTLMNERVIVEKWTEGMIDTRRMLLLVWLESLRDNPILAL
ncbi:MAG: hypothetical protein J6B96_06360 [Agathobacter sp.]|nr:hypothetical protein [Agathobacter sp.]